MLSRMDGSEPSSRVRSLPLREPAKGNRDGYQLKMQLTGYASQSLMRHAGSQRRHGYHKTM